MRNNWFQKKVEEITMDEKESGQKTNVSTDLDFNVRYFKSQLGGSFDIKYITLAPIRIPMPAYRDT